MSTTAATRPRVLLQTTIPYTPDDWNIGRFSKLRDELGNVADVVARDRENGPDGNDPVLLGLPQSDFDQVWIFAVIQATALRSPSVRRSHVSASRAVTCS